MQFKESVRQDWRDFRSKAKRSGFATVLTVGLQRLRHSSVSRVTFKHPRVLLSQHASDDMDGINPPGWL